MTANVSSVDDLINALKGMQKAKGVNHVGRLWNPQNGPEYLDGDVTLTLVFVNHDGQVVSSDDSYQPQEGEVPAIGIV